MRSALAGGMEGRKDRSSCRPVESVYGHSEWVDIEGGRRKMEEDAGPEFELVGQLTEGIEQQGPRLRGDVLRLKKEAPLDRDVR